ncbi:pyridoxamine 5'-phosphate oxidase family protein [Arthrobacter sp. H5]|uniref:pyridoxamine 5'-phosphate oxidase family protein n=1 Tax=Arthrobacter sp. H5 TaxID=1267973 RepID=UPI000688179B|nr:pyridoxamine 5'-phosphate oxidase family protein [Arthrobacter sp. H5]
MTVSPVHDEFWDTPGLLRASQALNTDACWALIAGQTTGRIGFLHEGLVTLFPLNCIVDDRGVYFRTSEGGIIASSHLAQAAFQLDQVDTATRSGWTVLINGPIKRITDPGHLKTLWGSRAEEPWAPGQRNVFFGIKPGKISGRRVHPAH